MALPANTEGRKHLAEAEPGVNVPVQGGGSAAPSFASVAAPAANGRAQSRGCCAAAGPGPICQRGSALFPAPGGWGVKAFRGRDDDNTTTGRG